MAAIVQQLADACTAGDIDALHHLLAERKADSSLSQEQVESLYAIAIAHDNAAILNALLETFRPFMPEEDDRRAVLLKGSPQLLQTILDHDKSQANAHYDHRGSALLVAVCSRRQPSFLATLLDAGADVNDPDTDGLPGLLTFAAALYETPEVLMLLRDHGGQFGGSGALCAAASRGMITNVRYLLECGVSPDEEGADGISPLHLAVKKGHTAIATLLLSKGATVDEKDRDMLADPKSAPTQ